MEIIDKRVANAMQDPYFKGFVEKPFFWGGAQSAEVASGDWE